jgi:hypothetical protein
MVIPGKLYEYLAAAKPIINIAKPASETAAIIASCGAGRSFGRTEEKELTAHLTGLVREWKERKTLDIEGNKDLVRQYSRGEMAKHLEEIIVQGKT